MKKNAVRIYNIIISIMLIAFLFYLIKRGSIYTYIHPRGFKLVKLMSYFLLLLVVNEIILSFKNTSKKFKLKDLILLIPFLLILFVTDEGLGTDVLKNRGIEIIEAKHEIKNIDTLDLNNLSVGKDLLKNNLYHYEDLTPPEGKMFKKAMTDISKNLDSLVGKEIKLDGFVYRDETIPKDQFVIARLLVVCCTADAQTVGFQCKTEDAKNFKDGKWYLIEGVLDITERENIFTKELVKVPLINIKNYQEIKKPQNEYIYP
ncbi:MAG: TIGR03943 family protein [Tissierellia bacterium]|nr:TIGR03943 family protein [Tissierellia bacterium]